MLVATATGAAASPHRRLVDELPQLDLDSGVPRQFASWQLDQLIAPVLPTADVRETLEKLYGKTLSRTYVNGHGYRIMLLIAYGADQADRTTLAHLPEACYSTQGFAISEPMPSSVALAGGEFGFVRLRTRRGLRVEPVSYWTTVGEHACNTDFERRLMRARYALRGVIPDGMLVRVSSLDADDLAAFAMQERFILDLHDALAPSTLRRIYGQPT